MIYLDKKYKNIPELFGGKALSKYPNLKELKDKSYFTTGFCEDFYSEDRLTYYTCLCGKGEIVVHDNYEEGMGHDTWVLCSCKDCVKKLKKENRNDTK